MTPDNFEQEEHYTVRGAGDGSGITWCPLNIHKEADEVVKGVTVEEAVPFALGPDEDYLPVQESGDGSITNQRTHFTPIAEEESNAYAVPTVPMSLLPGFSQQPQQAIHNTLQQRKQLNKLVKKLEGLKQKHMEQLDAREALEQEKNEQKYRLKMYEENMNEKVTAMKNRIKDKKKELEECVSEKQKIVLEEEIANEKRSIADAELERLRLENRSYTANVELAEMEKSLVETKVKTLWLEMEISQLESQILVEEKDAVIRDLKSEAHESRVIQDIHHSLASLMIDKKD